ncbi:hypothetical protein E2C01_033208 [Portunus trituberculatus]|uniref:Uncharacterized protein n=1 Tax=Portunus trituberculatus TaxID=210409 RepID=A0A5B7EZJ1_PORTR|nr:hypothetical protein [Portunus trituberculatus]
MVRGGPSERRRRPQERFGATLTACNNDCTPLRQRPLTQPWTSAAVRWTNCGSLLTTTESPVHSDIENVGGWRVVAARRLAGPWGNTVLRHATLMPESCLLVGECRSSVPRLVCPCRPPPPPLSVHHLHT